MQRLNYLLVSLAILAGCFGLALRGGQAAAANRRAAPLLRAPVQFPIDQFGIFQKEIRVGEIYSPGIGVKATQRLERLDGGKSAQALTSGTDIEATQYVEHWVLYDGYVYPGNNQPGLRTMIKTDPKIDYESETDFFARVPWGPGYRYVRVDCMEYDRLPGR